MLLTVGVSFVVADLCLAVFGGDPHTLPASATIQGSMTVGDLTYPWFRIFVIGLAIAIGVVLTIVQKRTRVGAIVRAGVDDREIISAMGVNIGWVFTGMFIVGAALAAIGGTIGAGVISVRPGIQDEVLLYALVVIIIGGLGSVSGAAIGSVAIGLIDAFAKARTTSPTGSSGRAIRRSSTSSTRSTATAPVTTAPSGSAGRRRASRMPTSRRASGWSASSSRTGWASACTSGRSSPGSTR